MARTMRLVSALLAAAFMALAPELSAAQTDPAKADAAKKASAAFVAMSKESVTTGRPPRQSDAAAKALLDAVLDTRDIDAAKSITFKDTQGGLNERLIAGVQVSLVYMLAGTGKSDIAQASADPAAIDRINRNVVDFAPEFGRIYDFQLKVQGAIIEGVLALIAGSKPADLERPNMKSGLAKIRGGSVRTVSGIMSVMTEPRLPATWRRERLAGLRAIAPKLVKLLEPGQKAEVRQVALEAAEAIDDTQVREELKQFATALAP